MRRFLYLIPACALVACEGDTGPIGPAGPQGPQGEPSQPLGHIEDTRVVFPRSELTVVNEAGVFINLVATAGHVGFRFYKDFGQDNEQQTHPWSIYIESLKDYQGLAILRDWLFTSALWDEEGRLLVGRLDPHPPANQSSDARFEVRGTLDEVQARIKAPADQSADIFQVGTGATHFAVDGSGNTIIGSASQPKEIILFDTADGTPYSLKITNGQLSVTKASPDLTSQVSPRFR